MSPTSGLYSLMWLPDSPTDLWDMASDEGLPQGHPVHQLFSREFLDLDRWRAAYAEYYRLWLEEDCAIPSWQHPLNWQAMLAAQCFNAQYATVGQIFCWLDVDRSQEATADFCWEFSPISGKPLTDLGPSFHPKHRLVSWADALVMPHPGLRE